jgi:cytochrome c-type biogenesis protein CcmE
MATTTFSEPRRKPVRQTKYLIGAILILGVIGYLIFFGLQSTSQYALDLSQLQAKGQSVVGQGVRVIGNLDQSSIQKDVQNNKIAFVITDGAHRLPIAYTGAVPDTFDKATEVIAEGKLSTDGTFNASLVLAKCPSKYDAADVPSSDYQWQTFGNNNSSSNPY